MGTVLSVFCVKFFAALSSLFFPILMALWVDKDNLSFISFVVSFVLLMSAVGSWGMKDWATKTVPTMSNDVQDDCIGRIVFISFLGGLLAALVSFLIAVMLYEIDFYISLFLSTSVLFLAVEYSVSGVNQATKSILRSVIPREILFKLLVIPPIYYFFIWFGGVDDELLSVFFLASSFIVLIVSLKVYYIKSVYFSIKNKVLRLAHFITSLYRDLSYIWLSSVVAVGFAHLDVILINFYAESEVAAEYYLASRLALGIVFFQWVQQVILAPFLAQELPKKNVKLIQAKLRNLCFLIFAPAFFSVLVFLYSKSLFFRFFSEFSNDCYFSFIVLSVSWLFYISLGPSDLTLLMAGKLKERLLANIFSIICLMAFISISATQGDVLFFGIAISAAIVVRALSEFLLVIRFVGFEYTYLGAFLRRS